MKADLRGLKKPLTKTNNSLLPAIEIIQKAYNKKVQYEITKILSRIESIDNYKNRDFFKLALFSILETVSYTAKSGGFLRLVEKRIDSRQVYKIFISRSEAMINDLSSVDKKPLVKAKIKLGDSRDFSFGRKFDAIITSPPYPNRHDYTRIYSLELIPSFISTDSQMKTLRYNTIRSHVEAKKIFASKGYRMPIKLKKNIQKIKAIGTNNPMVINMLEGYFEDMFLVLKQMRNNLKKNGKIALVVSNVRFSGENILVDELLSEIGSQVGLTPKKILIARYRGNSSQQMGAYQRNPSRESVVIWEK